MAVVGDNRGERDRPVAQRPDGSWSFEDARRRREQRQAERTAAAPPATGDPQEDLSALALSLADNLTIDGTPLSQLETRQELDGRDAPGRGAGDVPTAEEIMRALETEQHPAAASDNGSPRPSHDPRPTHPPHRPNTRRGPHHRRLYAPRRWVLASPALAAAVVVLAVQLASGTSSNPREHSSHTVATGTTAPTSGLIAEETSRFLSAEHAADHTQPRSTRVARPGDHHPSQTPARITTSLAGSSSPSTSTSATSGTSEAGDATEQASAPSSSPPSTSPSPESGQGSAGPSQTGSSSNSGSSSASPSKAALRALVTGAGTCGCQ